MSVPHASSYSLVHYSDDFESADRAARAEYHRQWRATNPGKQKEYKRRWEAKNPEKVASAQRRKYERHAGEYAERRKAKTAANPEAVSAKRAAYYAERGHQYYDANKRAFYDRHLRRKFGITVEDFDRMIAEQGGKCAVCETAFDSSVQFHIDHCHATGVIRGALCRHCNVGLGHFKDNPAALERAIAYLAKHKS